jgi:hypothetical protein
MEECMTILHTTEKGPMLNTIEKLYIYRKTLNNNKLNDNNRVMPNASNST